MTKRAIVLALGAILTACATTSSGRSGGSSNVLLADEIAGLSVNNAYQAVERARPLWLNARASGSPSNPDGTEPVVYLDGIRLGGLGELLGIRADVVAHMEYMRASDATNRYGTNHQGGAILVTTR